MSQVVDPDARSRKRKAILAAGVILGLGTAATLAAWTDDVWVSSSFSAGTFNVQAAVDNAATTWEKYAAPPGRPLTFGVSPTLMAPGTTVYAPLTLRIGPATSEYNGAITLATAPSGPEASSTPNNALFAALRLSLYTVTTPAECRASGTIGTSHLSNAQLQTISASTLLTLNGSTRAPQTLCFAVTLPTNASPDVRGGNTGQLIWNLRATSVERP